MDEQQPEPAGVEDDAFEDAPDDADSMASVVDIGRDEDVAAVCGRIDAAPTFAVVIRARRGNRALSRELGMRRLVRHVEDTGRTVAIATRSRGLATRARQSRVPGAATPERVRWNAGRRVVVGIGRHALVFPPVGSYLQVGALLAAVIVLGGALLFAGPSATVAVYPESTSFNDTLVISASLDQDSPDLDDLIVPATTLSATRTVTLALETTGTVQLPGGRARAEVLITNPTDEDILVAAGEVLFGPDFAPFTFDVDVVVPANGEATGVAFAQDEGPVGNVPAGAITGWANEDLRVLTLTNPEPATGGEGQAIRGVTEQDGAQLRTIARTLVDSDEMREVLAAQRPDAAIFLHSIDLAVSEGDLMPPPGEPADLVFMEATLVMTAVAIDASVLDQIAIRYLGGDEGEGIFVRGTVLAVDTGQGQSEEDGVYTTTFAISAEFSNAVAASDVRSIVSGKRPEAAEAALLEHEGIRAADVDLSPGLAPWLPRFGFRIDVEFRSLEEEPLDLEASPPSDDGENGAEPDDGATTDDESAAWRGGAPLALARHRSGRTAHGRGHQRRTRPLRAQPPCHHRDDCRHSGCGC